MKISIEGVEYSTISSCCIALGLSVQTVYWTKRMYNLGSVEDAIFYCLQMRDNDVVVYNGQMYKSKLSCCKELDINYNSVMRLVYNYSLSFNDSVDMVLSGNINFINDKLVNKFEYNGKVYRSKKFCCEELGLSYEKVLHYAAYHNLSFKDALEAYGKRGYFFRGVWYKYFSDLCNAFDVKGYLFNYWYKRHCNDYATKIEAFEVFLLTEFRVDQNRISKGSTKKFKKKYKGKDESVEYKGLSYDSWRDCCKKLGIKYSSVESYSRNNNITFAKALSRYIDGDIESNSLIFFSDLIFSDMNEFLNYLEVNHSLRPRPSIVERHIRLGDLYKWIINYPIDSVTNQSFKFRGFYYDTAEKCCESIGIKYYSFRSFEVTHRDRGWYSTKEESLEYFITNVVYEYQGNYYTNLVLFCKDYDVNYTRLRDWMLRNRNKYKTQNDALENYMNLYSLGYFSNSFTYNGVLYNSFSDLCDAYGVNLSRVYSLCKSGEYSNKIEAFETLLSIAKLYNYFDFNSSKRVFICKCKKCRKTMVLSIDLAFKHIEDCGYEDLR